MLPVGYSIPALCDSLKSRRSSWKPWYHCRYRIYHHNAHPLVLSTRWWQRNWWQYYLWLEWIWTHHHGLFLWNYATRWIDHDDAVPFIWTTEGWGAKETQDINYYWSLLSHSYDIVITDIYWEKWNTHGFEKPGPVGMNYSITFPLSKEENDLKSWRLTYWSLGDVNLISDL